MELKEMKVIDALRENVKILSELRIPIKEPQIWSAVLGVIQNTQICIEAMERAEAEAKAKSTQERAEAEAKEKSAQELAEAEAKAKSTQESADAENVVKMNAEERK